MVRTIPESMTTVASIIDDLGGTGKVAAALSLADNTVSSWRARGAIPSAHWAALVRFAKTQGSAITLETLALLAARESAEARP